MVPATVDVVAALVVRGAGGAGVVVFVLVEATGVAILAAAALPALDVLAAAGLFTEVAEDAAAADCVGAWGHGVWVRQGKVGRGDPDVVTGGRDIAGPDKGTLWGGG